MGDSEFVGKSVRVNGAGIGIIVEGYKITTESSPVTDVLKVTFPNGESEVLVCDTRVGFNSDYNQYWNLVDEEFEEG